MMSDIAQSDVIGLNLADGSRWAIQPADAEASWIVARLGKAMHLRPELGPARSLLVVVRPDGTEQAGEAGPLGEYGAPAVCCLDAATDDEERAMQLWWLGNTLAHQIWPRGGLLVHGALAEWEGTGVILAGPGGVGKSTASARLPSHWRALCDDTSLVVRDARGAYWAHPWPTWSRFLYGGPGGSWDVQRAVPLDAIFFLDQSPEDGIEAVGTGEAVCLLVGVAEQTSHLMLRRMDAEEARRVRLRRLEAAITLARAVPTYRLRVSLTGTFWKAMERALVEKEGVR